MSAPLTHASGLRVAIVGAGPAGLYAAVDLLQMRQGNTVLTRNAVQVFTRLYCM